MSILRKIESFLRDTGMAPTRFGRDAVRDHLGTRVKQISGHEIQHAGYFPDGTPQTVAHATQVVANGRAVRRASLIARPQRAHRP